MVQLILFIFVIAVTVFLYLKNRQYNRSVDRHNRITEKQEALMEMLRKKSEEENKENRNNEN